MVLDREKLYSVEEIVALSKTCSRRELSSKDAQQLYEATVIAQLISITKKLNSSNDKQKIKLADKQDQIPDVIVAYLDQSGSKIEYIEYEVVSFTPYSKKEGLVDFFKRTKLSPIYSYPVGTNLVCYIDLPINSPNKMCKQLSLVLNKMEESINFPIHVLCRDKHTLDSYAATIYPDFVELATKK